MKKYFKVTQAHTPTWHIKQISEVEFTNSEAMGKHGGVLDTTLFILDLKHNSVIYKIHGRVAEGAQLTPNQVRGFLSRYDACTGSERLKYPAGKVEICGELHKLTF